VVPKRYLGHAQTAFFGGRTSAHIRKVPVPVVYVDFLSMYPTVNALMGLWQFSVAEMVDVDSECAEGIEDFLRSVTVDALFEPATWMGLHAFVRIIPNGDVLPVRAKYSRESNDYQSGSITSTPRTIIRKMGFGTRYPMSLLLFCLRVVCRRSSTPFASSQTVGFRA
jgi:hypothetical protein